MDVPARILERRAELERAIEALQDSIGLHESDLAAQRAFAGRLAAQLGDVDLCISAIEDAAKTRKDEAWDMVVALGAAGVAGVAENAPAGSVGPVE